MTGTPEVRTEPPGTPVTTRTPAQAPCPLFVNPNSGALALRGPAGPEDLARFAADAGLAVDVVATESVEQMRDALRRLARENAPRVAVSGGDGTVAVAAQELAKSGVALGIIPQGSANNFARALGLPTDPAEAVRVIAAGAVRPVDLGRVGDRYFTESAGVGLFADMLREHADASGKNVFRILSAVIRVAAGAWARSLRLVVDGQAQFERALMCEITNTYRIAAALPIAPDARVGDGLLDVVVIGGLRRRDLPRYLIAVLRREHRDLPGVTIRRAREVRIESRRPLAVHADDQVLGHTPATVTVEPGALRVYVSPGGGAGV